MRADYLEDLNEAQREAVLYDKGPSLVIAGAGSGKTRVLVYKLVHLIYSGYEPQHLMALTFTNKAAREMRSRIASMVGGAASRIYMGTFHSVFSRILRAHAPLLGFTKDFTIYDEDDTRSRLKQLIKSMGLDDKIYPVRMIASIISRAKNDLITADMYLSDAEYRRLDRTRGMASLGEIYKRYSQDLKSANAMDFDDLLLYTNILFRDFPEVLHYWQQRVDYLLIDEYQDTNLAQYMIARKLVGEKQKLFVVGDDAQSIYSFRGAQIDHILDFTKLFPTAKVFKLEQNYRSTQRIVNFSSAVIAKNMRQLPKSLFSEGPLGDPIKIERGLDGYDEAEMVADRIDKLHYREDVPFEEIAILYRTHGQSRLLEQKLTQVGIPYKIWGGLGFYRHKEIKDILAYLRLMLNLDDEEAILRVINEPKRGIGQTTLDKLRAASQEKEVGLGRLIREPEQLIEIGLSKATVTKIQRFSLLLEDMRALFQENEYGLEKQVEQALKLSGLYQSLMDDTTHEGLVRQDNMQELLSGISEFEARKYRDHQTAVLGDYLSEVALYTDQDGREELDHAVTLMTIHAAKGLEFPYVFIVGLEQGILPSSRALEEPRGLEEERRLFYVAITRAMKACYISYAEERHMHGSLEAMMPSVFLKEIPEELYEASAAVQRGLKGNRRGSGSLWRPTRVELAPSAASYQKKYQRKQTREEPDQPQEQLGGYTLGDKVEHKSFGEGVITGLLGAGANAKAVVRFEDGVERKLLLQFAKLTKL